MPEEETIQDDVASLVPPTTSNNKYTLLGELGRGGMATAYLAALQGPGGFNKLMVVKRLRAALATEPEFLRMFLQEARLAARIDHANVVHTSEVGYDGENYFIAMEYLEGQSLESISRRVIANAAGLSTNAPPSSTTMSSSGPIAGATPTATSAISVLGAKIPLNVHLYVLTQVLAGLDYAHELKDFDGNPLNVVHRDVSPHNVMVTYEGAVKLVDFGIAKAADSNGDTRTGIMKGKCAYMPAEQFGGKVDRRADVFAVGVMLWQALTGRRLWKGLSDAEVFRRLSNDDIPTPSSVQDGVNPELEAICMKALSFRPDDRFSTAADFQAAIEDVVAGDRTLRATPRETGKYLAELFAADRVKVRKLIEQELGSRAAGAVPSTSELPAITAAVSAKTPGPHRPHARTLPSPVAVEVPEPVTAPPPAPAGRGRIFALVGVAVVAAGVLVFALRQGTGDAQAETTAATNSAPAPVAASVAPSTLRTAIVVTPADATISVDDAVLTGSQFDRDGQRHKLSVSAAGYESQTSWVVFDGEQVEITLTKSEAKDPGGGVKWTPPRKGAGGAGGKVEPPPSAPVAAPAPAPAPVPSAKKGLGLDTGDPWSGK